MSDLDNTIEYYKDLLVSQWVNDEKARGTIGALVGAGVCDLLPIGVRNGFDIETAIGAQLDILGEYIGFNRRVTEIIARTYFELDDYASPNVDAVGMRLYDDLEENINSSFYRYIYNQRTYTELNDDEYRFCLKFKILLNNCDSTLYTIQTLLNTYFAGKIYCVDNKDMTMDYYVNTAINNFTQIALSQNLLPKPMGVKITNIYTFEE
jgi:hypothetical protein